MKLSQIKLSCIHTRIVQYSDQSIYRAILAYWWYSGRRAPSIEGGETERVELVGERGEGGGRGLQDEGRRREGRVGVKNEGRGKEGEGRGKEGVELKAVLKEEGVKKERKYKISCSSRRRKKG